MVGKFIYKQAKPKNNKRDGRESPTRSRTATHMACKKSRYIGDQTTRQTEEQETSSQEDDTNMLHRDVT
jgi:hypothetical protein